MQNRKIAKDFAIYYDLFNKYKSDYQVNKILDGKADSTIEDRAKNAKFDERLALLGLVLDALNGELKNVCVKEKIRYIKPKIRRKISFLSCVPAQDMIQYQVRKTHGGKQYG